MMKNNVNSHMITFDFLWSIVSEPASMSCYSCKETKYAWRDRTGIWRYFVYTKNFLLNHMFHQRKFCYLRICFCVLFLIAATKGLEQLKAGDSTGDKNEEEQGIKSCPIFLIWFIFLHTVFWIRLNLLSKKQLQRDKVC